MLLEFINLASTEGGGSFNPIEFDPSALVLTWITFLVALSILTKVCWKPLLGAVKAREDRIADNIESAEKARTDAEELLAKYEQQIAKAKDEVNGLIEEGRVSAEKVKKEIMEKAQADAEAARERASKEIQLATDQALSQIRTEAIDLSISIASRILERSMDDESHANWLRISSTRCDLTARIFPAVIPQDGFRRIPARKSGIS